jgi:hypothetical protein
MWEGGRGSDKKNRLQATPRRYLFGSLALSPKG